MASSPFSVIEFINALFQIENAIKKAVSSIQTGISRVKHFQLKANWKIKVIHVPTAIQQIKDFIEDSIGDVLKAVQEVHDRFVEFRDQIEQIRSGASAYAGRRVPEATLLVLEFELIVTAIKEVAPVIEAAADFKPLFDGIMTKIENLEPIFLQQQNRRKREKLVGGGTISVRIPGTGKSV